MAPEEKSPASVEDYIALYPPDVQAFLRRVRAAVRDAAPEAEERISYGMPAYFQNGALVYFGAHARHVGLYPKSDGVVEAIPELSDFKGTKSSVHLPLDRPVPDALVRRFVEVRLAENLRRKKRG